MVWLGVAKLDLVDLVDKDDGGCANTEEGCVYVPGRVLVITSVSTVLVKSTMPSRLGASLAPSTRYFCFPFEFNSGVDGRSFSLPLYSFEIGCDWCSGVSRSFCLYPLDIVDRGVLDMVCSWGNLPRSLSRLVGCLY